MNLNPDLVRQGKSTKNPDRGKLFARRLGSSRTHDVIIAATLLALMIVAIVTGATISNEIADSNVDRRNYVAFVIDLVVTVGLSIGLGWLLFAARPHNDDE
jgi:high-affinity Fe2+/Pb2+ permease